MLTFSQEENSFIEKLQTRYGSTLNSIAQAETFAELVKRIQIQILQSQPKAHFSPEELDKPKFAGINY